MARIKLEIPQNLPFECVIPIRITDLNYAGHLAHDKVLSLMHEARMRFFEQLGYTELAAEGTAFIMGDCAVTYKSEGFYGQKVRVKVGAGDFSRVSFDLFYQLKVEGATKLLAEAKTGLICFNYESQKVESVPEALKARLYNPSFVTQL